MRADTIGVKEERAYDTEVQVLAVQERPALLVSLVLQDHLVATVGVITAASAGLFAIIDATTTETWGVGGVVAVMVTLVGVVFRTQQQQIRSQRVDMDHMAKRIQHLEAELDYRRGSTPRY